MGILKSFGDFMFGKTPDVFDEKGRILHKLPEDRWKDWDARFKANPDFDWKKHGAIERVNNPTQEKKNS